MAFRVNSSTSGLRCVKWMLLVINFMFMITGVLLILVGTTIQSLFGDFDEFIYDNFFSPPTLLVSIGAIMLAVSVFGCVGAIKQSTMLVNVYGVLLFVIFILEISAAIAAFCLQVQIKEMLITTIRESMEQYESSPSKGIDFMQSGLECCGMNNYKDWEQYLTNKHPVNANDTRKEIPMSCCEEFTSSHFDECDVVYEDGCLKKMHILLTQSAMLISTGAITVAFVEFLGILCAFMLAKTIRRNKTIRDARRWQLQQNLGITIPGKMVSSSTVGYTQMEDSGMNFVRSEPSIYTANSPSVN